jgi:cytochrome aa3-600 menaquinol oxidase subunit 2
LKKRVRPFLLAVFIFSVFLLSGCSNYVVLDPKGPVAQIQKDLILYSIVFMVFVVVVVYALFAFIVIKYRERKSSLNEEPTEQEGSKLLEIIWTVVPIIIVIALSIPTVKAIYALEKPPQQSSAEQPLVVYATSANWKWIFSYPEQNIETVNYLNIPKGRAISFKLTSADAMASFWIPALGGQKYAMAGMQTVLYLQADVAGTFEGRNANFNGEGFTQQTFKVNAQEPADWQAWVQEIKESEPPLTREVYDQLMLEGHVDPMTFSSTHYEWVNHAKDQEYALRARVRLGQLPEGTVDLESEPPAAEEGVSSSEHAGSH